MDNKTAQVANDLMIYNANLSEDEWYAAANAIEFIVDSLIKNEILSESFKTSLVEVMEESQRKALEDFLS